MIWCIVQQIYIFWYSIELFYGEILETLRLISIFITNRITSYFCYALNYFFEAVLKASIATLVVNQHIFWYEKKVSGCVCCLSLYLYLPIYLPVFLAIDKNHFLYVLVSLMAKVTFTLSPFSKGLQFWSINHTSIYENSELKVFENIIKFISNT